MSVNWELYEKLLTNGLASTGRDVVIQTALNSLLSGIVDDPAYQKDALINGIETPILANRESTVEAVIKAPPHTDLHIGDVIECLGETWLVVDLYTDKIGVINGKMWVCNHVVKFQNKTTAIHSRPCVIDDGTYTSRVPNSDVYAPANTYKMYISIDEETRRLCIDKRLAVGTVFNDFGDEILEVYKINGIDLKSRNFGSGSHLALVMLERDVYDAEADDINQGLCNVVMPRGSSLEPETPEDAYCNIVGKDTIRIGRSRTYFAEFRTDGDNSNQHIEARWDFSAPTGVNISVSDGACNIEVPLDANLVGSVIEITVIDDEGAYKMATKKVQVIPLG
jgi:hypothetical protein